MNKYWLDSYTRENARLMAIAYDFGLPIDFRDTKYLLDLCVAFTLWPSGAFWKDVFDRLMSITNIDASKPKDLAKVKQWTNRYFKQAIHDGLIAKTTHSEDRRVVHFIWTNKGIQLMKLFFENN